MFEDSVASIPSIWASMNSWFTPTVLFVVLNLMIGTIAITSSFANQKQPQSQQQQQPPTDDDDHRQEQQNEHHHQQQHTLLRSPSVLQRLRSINLYGYRLPEPLPTPPITAHFNPTTPDSDTLYASEQTHHHQTTQSESQIAQFVFEPTHLRNFDSEQTHLGNFDAERTHLGTTLDNLKSEQTHLGNFETERTHLGTTLENLKSEQAHLGDFKIEHTQLGNFETDHSQLTEEEVVEEDDEFAEDEDAQDIEEVFRQLERHVDRTTSDMMPASGELPVKLPAKMKKSASVKSAFAHFEESDIVEARRPATVRVRGSKPTEGDIEVDAKADDFINKFKQQLKLQRLDSIIRYKDVISRGTAK